MRSTRLDRYKLEAEERWMEIMNSIPSLKFKEEWDVKIIPPFAGAIARFKILKHGIVICSVYLDWYDNLGYFGSPYYELYPFEDDIKRYALDETDEMMHDIQNIWLAA